MPPTDTIKVKLLFVDDDRSFLDFLQQVFGDLSRSQWDMKFATDAAQALAVLRSGPMDLAILDLHMPDVDGLQLLRMLKREFPALQMAFLSGKGDEASRRIGLEEGAALFLEKPASLAGMESLFATLNELARWQQRMGERSVVRRAGLLDLVRMECKSRNSRIFEVLGVEETGQIWVKEGNIIHALAPEKRGQSAFTHLVCLPNAEFHLKPFAEPIERSVNRDWEFLVLEAARVQEQMLSAPSPKPPSPQPPVAPAPTLTPLRMVSSPVTERARPIQPPPVHRIAAAVPEVPVVPMAQAPPPARPAPAPLFSPVAAAPATRVLKAELHTAGLRIEEMLLSSDRREVYHEWQCAETHKWLSLIEFVSTKARQLGHGLPLGRLDRLELQAAAGRVVILHAQNRFVFVRSNTRMRAPVAATSATKAVAEWLAQQAPARGLLACGVALPDHKVLTQAFMPGIQLTALNAAWPCVIDTFETAARMGFPAWQLRWLFERAQLYCVRRGDGASLGLMLEKNAAAVDLPAVENLFAEFLTLRVA